MRAAKTDLRVVRCAGRVERLKAETLKAEIGEGQEFLTRKELAAVLKVSVRTVDEMVAVGEITPIRPRGVLVRFYLPDVVRELTAAAVARAGTTGLQTTDYGTAEPLNTRNTRKGDSK